MHEEDNHEASIEYLLKALTIDPVFYPAKHTLALRYRQIGRLADSQYHLEAIVRADPLNGGSISGLFQTYTKRKMWDKARELIQLRLKQTDGDQIWQLRLANTNYLQSGDKEAYITEMEGIPEFIEDPKGKPWKALMQRDYETALQYIDGIDTGENLRTNRFQMNMRNSSLYLRPLSLLAAVIWFELGDEDKMRLEAKKAREYLEWVIGEDPGASRDYLWNLMVCYALEGNRKKMESTNATVGESFAESSIANYKHQSYHYTYRAMAYLILGDQDMALEDLEKASQLKGPIFLHRELDLWFIFDRLRGNPRFDALLKD
jgi:tetratricopeptide (TPR) repeat protein